MDTTIVDLITNGVAVFTIAADQNDVDCYFTKITNSVKTGPELVHPCDAHPSKLVGGSFGALGFPTSWHASPVRELRKVIYDQLAELGFFQSMTELTKTSYVEMLADRLRYQQKGTVAGSEKEFHRDESTAAVAGDIILGGWFNMSCDGTVQQFSCLKGTQLQKNNKGGFTKKKPTAAQLKQHMVYDVKPGQLILFYQNILHNVKGGKLKADSTRLHFGLRFTNAVKPLFPLDSVFENFETFKLPSGQSAEMYPKLWWTNWRAKLDRMSAMFNPALLNPVTVSSGKHKGETHIVVPKVMELTTEMRDAQPYPPYTEEEKRLYMPIPPAKKRGAAELHHPIACSCSQEPDIKRSKSHGY